MMVSVVLRYVGSSVVSYCICCGWLECVFLGIISFVV